MKMLVAFESSPEDCPSERYIQDQPEWQRRQLQNFVDELLSQNKIDHTDARKLANGRWSLWIRKPESDAINHVCYLVRADEFLIDRFANEKFNTNQKQGSHYQQKPKKLMIKNQDEHAIQIGRAEAYLEPEYYAQMMDTIQREIFLKVISDIRSNSPSQDYMAKSNGHIEIQIDKPEVAYGIRIRAIAKWI